jgi:RNA polymerase primary sigma factor
MMPQSTGDRIMEAYYTDVRTSCLLTAEEERGDFRAYRTCTKCGFQFRVGVTLALCPQCKTVRNCFARDRLIKGALLFVVKLARNYARKVQGDSDLVGSLVSAGNLGLLIAVDKFDLKRQTRFLTYAAWWVRVKMLEELDSAGVVRIPAYRQKAARANYHQCKNDGRALMVQEVAIEDMTEIDRKHHDESLERNMIHTYGTDVIYDALATLHLRERDKYIVLAYFGVREEPKNLRQISNRLALSSERIRQIKTDVLAQVRAYLEARTVHETSDLFTE